jgi:hypothetical protein
MSKTQSRVAASPTQDALPNTAAEATAEPKPGRKAVVLGRVRTRGGRTYQVLAPAIAPQHLSMDDIEHAVQLMVAAR